VSVLNTKNIPLKVLILNLVVAIISILALKYEVLEIIPWLRSIFIPIFIYMILSIFLITGNYSRNNGRFKY